MKGYFTISFMGRGSALPVKDNSRKLSWYLRQNFGILKMSIKIQFNYFFSFSEIYLS